MQFQSKLHDLKRTLKKSIFAYNIAYVCKNILDQRRLNPR